MNMISSWRPGEPAFALDVQGRRVGVVEVLASRPALDIWPNAKDYYHVRFVTPPIIWYGLNPMVAGRTGLCSDWPRSQLRRPEE